MGVLSFRRSIAWALAGCSLLGLLHGQASKPLGAPALYAQLCSSCHGVSGGGGGAPSLRSANLRHGSDDASLSRSIRDGLPGGGMPSFGAALSESQILALVVHLRELERRASPPAPTAARQRERIASRRHDFEWYELARGFSAPWGVALAKDGRFLVSLKEGAMVRVDETGNVSEPLEGLPSVAVQGQGGLLGVAIEPASGDLFFSFAESFGGGKAMTSLARARLASKGLEDVRILFRSDAASARPGGLHFGSRIAFDGRGHVFFSIGERGQASDAQRLDRPNGKIHRLHLNGEIPADNPFAGRAEALASIFSYGHRNPQGLVFDSDTGDLLSTEHGPRGGDELNLILPGSNYGWPLVSFGMNYDGTPLVKATSAPGLVDPLWHWTPSIAVGDLVVCSGRGFPRWKGDLLVTSLAQQELHRLRLRDGKVVESEVLLKGLGRLRALCEDAQGRIVLAVNQEDRLLVLEARP